MAGLVPAIHVFPVIPGRCVSIEPGIHRAKGIPGKMDSGLASSMRPGMTDDDELNYPSFNTDTKNPSVPVRRGVIKSPSAVQNRRVDKASGSRERAPDDRLRVPTVKGRSRKIMVGTAQERLCPSYVASRAIMAGHSRSKNGVASARLCPAIHVFPVIPGRCVSIEPGIHRAKGIPGKMDSGLASSMRPGMTNDDELNYPSFSTDTKNPSVPVRRGVIKSPSELCSVAAEKSSALSHSAVTTCEGGTTAKSGWRARKART